MTERPESLQAAIADRDVTLALTPGQLLLLVVGVWALVRFLRGLRS
ncbi:MAG TPA: hypothetical protein VFN76_04350 [Candidatus Limnocylindria bacterium]|nr:hypothetical protein [Candidatus Limnocylindria bacterium]